jgi:lipid-binding SYLF domain-containing protein
MRSRLTAATLFTLTALFAMLWATSPSAAGPGPELDASVNTTLNRFFHDVGSSRELANKAAAILVFPTVIKAGFGVGGEYGEGAMHMHGRTVAYFNIASASFGFQLGAQARSVIIMFMTEEALAGFRSTHGWKVGVDGSVAIITVGAGGAIDTNSIRSPVVGFIFDQKGLMYNLTLEGSKISEMSP